MGKLKNERMQRKGHCEKERMRDPSSLHGMGFIYERSRVEYQEWDFFVNSIGLRRTQHARVPCISSQGPRIDESGKTQVL